ncbi:30S ribosomal protein S2 [Candidatus Marinimicrobia bacterium]|nr:30S ribosomal protein S2 [Candidatus Neomarinimicrobiota bacterium]
MNIEELIKAGAHFGHPASKWNPNYKQFISSIKNGIHIINLEITLKKIDGVMKELSKIVSNGGNILFVGTKSQAKDAIQLSADHCGMFYITERWLGGTLTNYSTIKKSIRRLKLLEKDSSPIYANLTKKERSMLDREKLRLADLHRGIKDMRHLPSAIFVVDAKHEKIAISESKCLGIPTFGIVDTNTDPDVIDFPIPANDDSIKTIQLILNYIATSLQELMGQSQKSDDSPSLTNVETSDTSVIEGVSTTL